MASIIKKKLKRSTKYYISHRYTEETGRKKQKWIPCIDKHEALYLLDDVMQAEEDGIEYIRPKPLPKYSSSSVSAANKSFMTANDMKVSDLMIKYVEVKCAEDWEASTLKTVNGIISNYINPFIGDVLVTDLSPAFIQDYYNDLPNHPAVTGNHKNAEPKAISPRTVREVHKIIRPALNMAAVMGIITINPALPVKLPKQPKFQREQWTAEEVKQAQILCEDANTLLYTRMMSTCTLRSGELSALTWDCVDVSDEAITKNEACIWINKTLRRLSKEAIAKTKTRSIIYMFPNLKPNSATTLVLKAPKTDTSVRRIYLTETVARQLAEHKAAQERLIAEAGDEYTDYGYQFVFTQINGRPFETKILSKKFTRFVDNAGLRKVDAYSLRHSGATSKLRASGGNIKAVQGDMGHASTDMLMNTYAAIQEEDRKVNAINMEQQLISKQNSEEE